MTGRRPTFLVELHIELSPGPAVPLANEMPERIAQQRAFVEQFIRERLYELNHARTITDEIELSIISIAAIRLR